MKRLLLSIACLLMLTGSIWAQERSISGKISDGSGEALPGVTVLVKGTTTGTQSDFDGNFRLNIPAEGTHLVFSFVGMSTQEAEIGNQTNFSITMEEDAKQLEEIVVTALGVKRTKKSLGYAQQTVEAEELVSSKQADVVNAMAGKIAGVQVMSAPKSGFNQSQIRLRGSTNVLYVVDGIRLQSSDDINPEDIESMSVLKGSAATALYGPTGRNGVVIITTSRAKKGGPTIKYDAAVEVSRADFIPEIQTEYGGGYGQTFPKFSYDPSKDPESWAGFDGDDIVEYYADESWGPRLEGQLVRQWDSWIPSNPNFGQKTPWVANGGLTDFFETGVNYKNSLTFFKSGENYNVKLNLLRNNRTLNIPNSERVNNRASLSADFNVTPKFKISTTASFQNRRTLNNPTEGYGSVGSNVFQWWQAQLDVDKLKDYRQGGQPVSWNITSPRNPTPKYWDSPYLEFYENTKNASRRSIIGNFQLDYTFNDMFRANLSYRKTYTQRRFDARTAWGGLDVPAYSESESTEDYDLLTGQLFFNKKITNDLNVSAIAGFETNNYEFMSTSSSTQNGLTIPDFYSIASSKERPSYSSRIRRSKGRAAYITTSAGYKDMLFLDANFRRDWSSTAKIDENNVTSVGASLSFVFSELIPQNDILSYGKFRVGVAQGPSFPSPYSLNETFGTRPLYGSRAVQSIPSTLTNLNLTGGLRQEVEVGTELRFLQGKIGLDVAYFTKVDTNLPSSLALDPTTGYSSVLVNSGEQNYKGIEVTISGTPVDTDDFTWNTSFNFATLKRNVVELAEGVTNNDFRFLSDRWGGLVLRDEVGQRWGEVYGTKVQTIGGKKVLDESGRYVTEANQSLGNYLPDFTGGFINSLKYKDFSLNIDMDYQIGGKYFSITQMFNNYTGLGTATVGNNELGNPVRDPVFNNAGEKKTSVLASDVASNSGGTLISGVTPDGDDVAYYIDTQTHWYGQFGNISEFTYNASYLMIRNIRLGYDFPKEVTEKLKLQGLNFSVYVNNALLLFSDLPNIDPSQLEQRYGGVNFMEGGQLPGVRTYGFNLRLSL